MISVDYCQLQARYNRWINERLYAAAEEIGDAERKRNRGAFFGSIHRTLCHILWGDRTWLGRFTGSPCAAAAFGADMVDDFGALLRERETTDVAILEWTSGLTAKWLATPLRYHAASDGRERELPAWIAATHLFQHAVHHRGQVTTLLKQAGRDPGVTDLPYLPGVVRIV